MIDLGLLNYVDKLEEISGNASREYSLENNLRKMKDDWANIEFECTPYRDSGVSILTSLDDIQVMLDEHTAKAQTMHGSVYIKHFEEEMDAWEKKLLSMQEILEIWVSVSIKIFKIKLKSIFIIYSTYILPSWVVYKLLIKRMIRVFKIIYFHKNQVS